MMVDDNKTERIQLLMTPPEVTQIEDYWHEHHLRSRSEAIRRLIRIGLKAERANPEKT